MRRSEKIETLDFQELIQKREDFQDGQVLEGMRFANPFAGMFDREAWV